MLSIKQQADTVTDEPLNRVQHLAAKETIISLRRAEESEY